MMSAMLEHPGPRERDLSSLRLCLSSGEALPARGAPPLARHVRRRGARGRRLVRAVPHLPLEPARPRRARAASASSCPATRRSCSTTTATARSGRRAGRALDVRARAPALCYWGDHERSKRTFHGDTVRTGDLFVRDADGFFWYRGRADDLLKVGGIWVAPLEVENCLLAHPAVAECRGRRLRGGRPDAARARSSSLRDGRRAGGAGELQDFVRSRALAAQVPARRPLRRASCRRRRTGKVDRKALGNRRGGPRLVDGYVVGIDIGGTCTDCVVVDGDGRRHARQGVLDAAGLLRRDPRRARHRRAAARHRRRDDLLASTRLFLHSTTVAENAVVDGTLATAGIDHDARLRGHALRDARRLRPLVGAHRGREAEPDRHRQAAADRAARPDRRDPRAHRRERRREGGGAGRPRSSRPCRRSSTAGVEAIGVCTLWSFVEPGRRSSRSPRSCGGSRRTSSSRSRTRSRRSSASTSAPRRSR